MRLIQHCCTALLALTCTAAVASAVAAAITVMPTVWVSMPSFASSTRNGRAEEGETFGIGQIPINWLSAVCTPNTSRIAVQISPWVA